MTLKTLPFDAADGIKTADDVAYFLEAAFEDADAAHIAKALGVVARAGGMTELAEKTGLSRQALYKALSANGNPSLDTVLRVMGALGLHLTVKTPQAA